MFVLWETTCNCMNNIITFKRYGRMNNKYKFYHLLSGTCSEKQFPTHSNPLSRYQLMSSVSFVPVWREYAICLLHAGEGSGLDIPLLVPDGTDQTFTDHDPTDQSTDPSDQLDDEEERASDLISSLNLTVIVVALIVVVGLVILTMCTICTCVLFRRYVS